MIRENSGKIYRFKLEHELGFGYAQVEDFTDISKLSGRFVFVFDLWHKDKNTNKDVNEIVAAQTIFGPGSLFSFPNTRGKHSWKLVGQTSQYQLDKWPKRKSLTQGMIIQNKDWSQIGKWYVDDLANPKDTLVYQEYETLRSLETGILNDPSGVVIKVSMWKIIQQGGEVGNYYDLNELGNYNLYTQLVNTYFDRQTCNALLSKVEPPYKVRL